MVLSHTANTERRDVSLEILEFVNSAVATTGYVIAYVVLALSLLVIGYLSLFAARQNIYIQENKTALVKVSARHERENSELSAQALRSRTTMLHHYQLQRKIRFQKATVVLLASAVVNTLVGFVVFG